MAKRYRGHDTPDMFYTPDPSDGKDVSPDQVCTPELLLEFIRKTQKLQNRFPTLLEIKHEFGGIIGAIVDGWELQRRGLIKKDEWFGK